METTISPGYTNSAPSSPVQQSSSKIWCIQKNANLDSFKGMIARLLQPCLTLCDPMACSLPRSSVQGILQARILEWVVISSSRGSSPPRDQALIPCVSWIAGWFLTCWATGEVHGMLDKLAWGLCCWLTVEPDLELFSLCLPFSIHFTAKH